jgi:type IV pilus secretin PilQ/predicted competence protein
MRKKNRIFIIFLLISFIGPNLTPCWGVVDEGKTISMNFDGASLKDVLTVFSQQSGMNFISSQDVESKRVTVYFNGVSVKDALDSIMKANKLRYERKDGTNIFLVYDSNEESSGLETRIFKLKYTRLSISPLDVAGQQTISNLGGSSAAGSSSGSTSTSSTTSSSTGTTGSSGSSGGSTIQRGIDHLVATLLSSQGKLTADIYTNSLIVTDTPEKLDAIEEVLKQIDVPPAQVMIEVYLIEVKKSLLDDLGIEWGGTNGEIARLTAGSRSTAFPFAERLLNVNKGVKATSQGTSTLTLGTLDATSFKAILHYISTQIDTKVLARPRILALNNEAANIRLVTNQTTASISTSTTTPSGQTITSSSVAERTEVGISLQMTPQINVDDSIGLFLEPSVRSAGTSSFSSSFLDPTTRSIRTMARVKDHETLVIGGLIDSDRRLSTRKVPLFGDLPLVGRAFKYNDRDHVERELLIFITPHIVKTYDSLSENSATPTSLVGGRDLAIKRMLDHFKDRELNNSLSAWEQSSTVTHKITPMNKPVSPIIEREMSQALSAASAKQGSKPNR